MDIKKFIYHNVSVKVQNKHAHAVLKFFYDVFYANTRLNRDYRVRKFVKKANRFILKNSVLPIWLDGKTAVVEENNVKYFFYPDKPWLTSPLYRGTEYEEDVYNYTVQKIKGEGESKIIFDIGANMGIYCINLAKVSDKNLIYAFEPAKETYELLKKNLEINNIKNVLPQDYAISDKNGKIYFSSDQFSDNHILNKQEGKSEVAKAITMDTFVKKNGIKRIDLIKCDVEGAELLFIKGAMQTLKSFKPIIVLEVTTWTSKRYNYVPKDIFDILLKMGYTYRLGEQKLKAGNVKHLDEELKKNFNFVFEFSK